MSGTAIAVDMKTKGKSKDSLDQSLDSLESGDSRTDDSLEILHDSLGRSQLTYGNIIKLGPLTSSSKPWLKLRLQKIFVMK